jgi:hypothetical protein
MPEVGQDVKDELTLLLTSLRKDSIDTGNEANKYAKDYLEALVGGDEKKKTLALRQYQNLKGKVRDALWKGNDFTYDEHPNLVGTSSCTPTGVAAWNLWSTGYEDKHHNLCDNMNVTGKGLLDQSKKDNEVPNKKELGDVFHRIAERKLERKLVRELATAGVKILKRYWDLSRDYAWMTLYDSIVYNNGIQDKELNQVVEWRYTSPWKACPRFDTRATKCGVQQGESSKCGALFANCQEFAEVSSLSDFFDVSPDDTKTWSQGSKPDSEVKILTCRYRIDGKRNSIEFYTGNKFALVTDKDTPPDPRSTLESCV